MQVSFIERFSIIFRNRRIEFPWAEIATLTLFFLTYCFKNFIKAATLFSTSLKDLEIDYNMKNIEQMNALIKKNFQQGFSTSLKDLEIDYKYEKHRTNKCIH